MGEVLQQVLARLWRAEGEAQEALARLAWAEGMLAALFLIHLARSMNSGSAAGMVLGALATLASSWDCGRAWRRWRAVKRGEW